MTTKLLSAPEITLVTNANGDPVYAYSIDSTSVYAPMRSTCGRFTVDPLKVYGLTYYQVKALQKLNKAFHFNDNL